MKNIKNQIIVISGYPASGKSTLTKQLVADGYMNFNRDNLKCSLLELNEKITNIIKAGQDKIVLDNTYATVSSRAPLVNIAKKFKYNIELWEMGTSFEDAQFNAIQRQIERTGKLMQPEDFKLATDPNLFPPAVIYVYKKEYQPPSMFEGFDMIRKIKFERKYPTDFNNKAVIFDYDGTLRETISGKKFPTSPDDIKILPGRTEKLKKLVDTGYLLLGLSNQSGIAKGDLSYDTAKECFEYTNQLLGFDIDVQFCSHSVPPIICYCRKPSPGYGVHFIQKYKLNPNLVTVVGDMTSDKTFAKRCGFRYVDQKDFFTI